MNALNERITSARVSAGMSKAALARAVGVSSPTVTDWESGKIKTIEAGNMSKLAAALGVTPDWLLYGKEPAQRQAISASVAAAYDIVDRNTRPVPIISYVQAGNWCELVDAYPTGHGEDTVDVDVRWGPNTYALRVRGDSMAPTLTEGAVIVVDPAIDWRHGHIVVVRQNGDAEVTVKRLVKDGGTWYLKPDNPRYEILTMEEDAHVCGVVVEQIQRFV